MNGVAPYIRHMLLCEDVRPDPANPLSFDLRHFFQRIHPPTLVTYPFRAAFSVLVVYTGGRGAGEAQIRLRSEATGQWTYAGQHHAFPIDADPLRIRAVTFRIAACSFPDPGLYWVELWYNGDVVQQEPLTVG
jgi:hypothetical protein